jgi:hypothetical protein
VSEESNKPKGNNRVPGLTHVEDDERRHSERRRGVERRGALRWDPRADERRRRSEIERRRRGYH